MGADVLQVLGVFGRDTWQAALMVTVTDPLNISFKWALSHHPVAWTQLGSQEPAWC